MDQDSKDALETGLTVVLRPITDIAEAVLGLAGGDQLQAIRERNRAKISQKTKRILEERGVKPDGEVSPSIMIPLLKAAQDESQEALQELYAKLLVASADPKRRGAFRREFIEIVRQLEPLDLAVLEKIQNAGSSDFEPTKVEFFAQQLEVPIDHVVNAMAGLVRLGLTDDKVYLLNNKRSPVLSVKGRQFLAAVAN